MSGLKILSVLALFAGSLKAQEYTLDLQLTGGAGESSGGAFSVQGRVGQYSPHRIGGGNYVLEIATFGQFVPPFEGDVALLTSYSNGALTMLWDRASTNFDLETTTSLAGNPQWTRVESPPDFNTTHFYISLPASSGERFFRLRRR